MQAFDLIGFSSLPAPHHKSRSAMILDVPGRITNLYGRTEISELHHESLSIVDLVEFTLVVDGSKMYLRLLWLQYIVNIFRLKR